MQSSFKRCASFDEPHKDVPQDQTGDEKRLVNAPWFHIVVDKESPGHFAEHESVRSLWSPTSDAMSEEFSDEDDQSVASSRPARPSGGRIASKVVPRDYLPTDSAILATHVASAYPDDYNKASEEQRQSWLNAMNKDRQDCRSWAAMKIEQMFVTEAREQGLDVHTVEQIKALWQKDGSDEMATKMFAIMYGQFDTRTSWGRDLETEYMRDYANIVYSKEARSIGCFQSLITHKKCSMVVAINNATKTTHKRRINISRPKAMITDENRFKKRNKGVFDSRYVVESVVPSSMVEQGMAGTVECAGAESVAKVSKQ